MFYSREERKDDGDKRGNEWQIILAVSILLPTYHKVISNSSYFSSIAQPDLFEVHDSHGLPMGPPRFWGGHRSIKTARPGKKVPVFCIYLIMYLFILCLHFAIV